MIASEASTISGRSSPQLVLASTSPRRKELLAAYGYEALVAPSLMEESEDAWLTVPERVLLNAVRKSKARFVWRSSTVVMGVDTLVSLDGKALGKPRDLKDAGEMVARLCGRSHQVFTGVALRREPEHSFFSFVEESEVTFLALSAIQIAAYHSLINPLDKAGGYAAQEHSDKIIASLEGSWTNVIGLPIERLSQVLTSEFGINPVRVQVV